MLEIRTFGGLSLHLNGKIIKNLGLRKAEAILVYLAAEGGFHNRNVLATLLWPESTEGNALTSLRVALSILRKEFEDYLEVSRNTIGIKPGAQVYLDLFDLEDMLASEQVIKALRIYKGDFLLGFYIHDSQEFENWRRWQQERVRRLVVSALHVAISNAIEIEDYNQGQNLAHHLLEIESLDELAHRQCMLLFALDGQRALALEQYEKCKAVLQAELGVQPSQETQELYAQISHGAYPGVIFADILAHNFPTLLTSFIGREQELAQIAALIRDPACRLLTLVGPGGIGKTRLALQAASKVLRYFSDGAYFIPLEQIASPDFLVPAIADAILFKIDNLATQLDHKYQLLDYLKRRSILLVLDGFEHLVAGAGLLSELIGHAPKVKLLVTSRQNLDLSSEWTFPVAGLPVPQTSESELADDASALRLFVERARQANASRQLSKVDRENAIHICRLLEGLPLGIELAAACTSMLSPHEITKEMQKNLDFLTISAHDVVEKHRSLRAAFESSWLLLDEGLRDTFCRLSVFQGWFDRLAALQVARVNTPQLSVLVNKSLLETNTNKRFFMHLSLRQYANEKMEASLPNWEDVHNQHCIFYTGFLSQREPDLIGKKMFTAWEEVRQEFDNIRAAVNWAVIHCESEKSRKLLNTLLAFYSIRGWQEGKDTFRDIAKMRGEALVSRNILDLSKDPLYISARIHQAFLQCNLGQTEESDTISRECLEPLSETGLKEELSECLHNLGTNASFRGNYEYAVGCLEEAIRIGKASQHFIWPTYLLWLGHVYFLLGEYETGMESFRKCHELFDLQGNFWGLSFALSKMGLAADGLGEFHQAMHYHQQAFSIFEEIGNQAGKAYALSRMSMSAYFLEDYSRAIQFGEQGYQIFQLLGHRWGICTSLCRLGFAFIGLGKFLEAKVYFSQALQQSQYNQMAPISLYALAGLAATLAQENEEKKAIQVFQEIQHHPQIPALYVKQAARWIVRLDQLPHRDTQPAVSTSGEPNDIDATINRLMKIIGTH